MRQANVAHDIGFYGAHLINPDNWAFEGNFSNFGSVWSVTLILRLIGVLSKPMGWWTSRVRK